LRIKIKEGSKGTLRQFEKRYQKLMTTFIYKDHLESDRLLTRKLTSNDSEIWSDFFRDKEAIEFLPDPGISSVEERAKLWIDKQLNRYADHQFGLQALIDKKTNQFIGQCGLLKQIIDGQTEIEVGYHIFKKYWGQGYAPEAAKLFINYAFQNNITNSVTSIINIKNIKSQRVADKNSLKKEKQTMWSGLDVFIYRIDK
jgi:RimJ/RimL family protein N-acetyltransferase